MDTLNKVIEMQNQNMTDAEISTQLQNNGVPPREIQDALNQANIKKAVSNPENNQEEQYQQPPTPNDQQNNQQPQTPETYYPQNPPQPEYDYYQPTPQAYSQQNYYAPQESFDPETISEIAEQVVTEKLEEFTKQTGDIASFKNSIQDKVADIDERLKKIENSIDKLQQAIIGKIGEFGESNALIHKDLDNLHNTVSKLMNPLVDNINEMKKANNP